MSELKYTEKPAGFLKLCRSDLLMYVLFFGLQLGLQWANGAFDSEFGGYPDEAAHYVTGLMVHDYVFGMNAVSPRKFAENYYIHYPKVAIGHWPPFFYMVQSVWMLVFSCSRVSVILLMVFLTALLAETIYLTVRQEFGFCLGAGMGFLLILLPLIQKYSGMVMAEILVALLSLWAVICFARFLDTEKTRWSAGFGIFAALAILTKGNGLALALISPLGIVFSQRFYLISRPKFWYPALIVVVICGPWYWLTLDMVRNGWEKEEASLSFILSAISYYTSSITEIGGFAFLLLSCTGFIRQVFFPEGKIKGITSASAALVFSIWGFHILVPAGMEIRHLITAVPAMLIFLAAGITFISERVSGILPTGIICAFVKRFCKPFYRQNDLQNRFTENSGSSKYDGGKNIRSRYISIFLLVLFSLIFYHETFSMSRKAWSGFGDIARDLLSETEIRKSVFMISSDERGEGMFISELAMQEHPPGHIVLRSSKILAESRWSGAGYKVLYSNPDDIMICLREFPAGIVIIDESLPSSPQFEHNRLLSDTIKKYADQWEFSGKYSLTRDGKLYSDAIKVWRLIGHENQPVKKIQLNMAGMLGKVLEKVF
jgi:hypothetical protein